MRPRAAGPTIQLPGSKMSAQIIFAIIIAAPIEVLKFAAWGISSAG
jgi:hypothetical protein